MSDIGEHDEDFAFGHAPHGEDSPEQPITQENALVVIAQELRSIKRTLHVLTFGGAEGSPIDEIGRGTWAVNDTLEEIRDRLRDR